MIEVLRSGVNTWECDQMGHLNVRHYFGRANHGLVMLALQLGLPPSEMRAEGLVLRAREQHVRFIRELRPGTYYTVHAGVVSASAAGLYVYKGLGTQDHVPLPLDLQRRNRALHGDVRSRGDLVRPDHAQVDRHCA